MIILKYFSFPVELQHHPWILKALTWSSWSSKVETWRRKWQPTPAFLPGESHGQRSLVDMESHRVGHDWSDLAWNRVYDFKSEDLGWCLVLSPTNSVSSNKFTFLELVSVSVKWARQRLCHHRVYIPLKEARKNQISKNMNKINFW